MWLPSQKRARVKFHRQGNSADAIGILRLRTGLLLFRATVEALVILCGLRCTEYRT